MSNDRFSLKNWWTRRLCIKRVKRQHRQPRKAHRHQQQQLQSQCVAEIKPVDQPTPETGDSLCVQHVQGANLGRNTSSVETKADLSSTPLPGLRNLPSLPSPRLLTLTSSPFSPVLPKTGSRLQTILEEVPNDVCTYSVAPQVDHDKVSILVQTSIGIPCESSKEEATAANSFSDCSPSDDIDSRAIFESDIESVGNTEAGSDALQDAILDESILAEQCEAKDNELDEETAVSVTLVTDVSEVHPPLTRSVTPRLASLTPQPSLNAYRMLTLPWLSRCGRTRRKGHRSSSSRASNSNACSEEIRVSPEVRLEKLSVRPLPLVQPKLRGHCFEACESSFHNKTGEEDRTSADNVRSISMLSANESKLDVVGVAYNLHTSDFDSSASNHLSTVSLNHANNIDFTLSPSTNLSSNLSEATAVKTEQDKSESFRVSHIWLEESSNCITRIAVVHKNKPSSGLSTESPPSKERAELIRTSASQAADANEVANKSSKFPNVPTVAHNFNSREKKLKVKRNRPDDKSRLFKGAKLDSPGDTGGNARAGDKTVENKKLTSDPAVKIGEKVDGSPFQALPSSFSALRRCCSCYCGCCACCYCGLYSCRYQRAFGATDAAASRVPDLHCQNYSSNSCEPKSRSSPHCSSGFSHQYHHQHHHHHQHACRCVPMCCLISDEAAICRPVVCQPAKCYINPHSPSQFNKELEPFHWQAPQSLENQRRQMIAKDENIAKAVSPSCFNATDARDSLLKQSHQQQQQQEQRWEQQQQQQKGKQYFLTCA